MKRGDTKKGKKDHKQRKRKAKRKRTEGEGNSRVPQGGKNRDDRRGIIRKRTSRGFA
jgi:hypothetical protein